MKVVFIHGAGCTGAVWHFQERHFGGCDVVTLPGHPHGKPLASIEAYREWLRDYIIRKNFSPSILAGQSMGGGIALSYAIEYPGDTNGLVLIGTGARLRVHPSFLKILSDNVDKPPSWYREVVLPLYTGVEHTVREIVLEQQCNLPVSVHLNDFLCCDRFDMMDAISEIKAPTLILCGAGDTWTPLKYSQYLSDRIPGSRLAVMPDAGHLVFLEKPDDVNREVDAFLGGLNNCGTR